MSHRRFEIDTVHLVFALLLAIPASGRATESIQNRGGFVSGVSLENGVWWAEANDFRSRLPLSQTSRVVRTLRSQESLWVAAIDDDSGPTLRLVEAGKEAELGELRETPDVGRPKFLAEPSFVFDHDGALSELIWLAGRSANETALYAASWNGRWAAPVVVSPIGPGTQIALSSCTLGNSQGLAVWVAYDGTDDEVMWTVGGAGRWSRPRKVSQNSVPDIIPALACTPGGAVLVWSWYDGNDYRLVTSLYHDETWSSPLVIGPKGSTRATFVANDPLRMVFHRAWPRGWGVIELGTDGAISKIVTVASNETETPRLVEVSRGEIALEWRSATSKRAVWTVP